MKKLLVVLLSLGLIVAFGMTASAQGPTVKLSGHYYAVGVYQDNGQLLGTGSYSAATVFQRWRMTTDLQIAKGLNFVFRFDALEKQWGQTDMRNGVAASGVDNSNSRVFGSTTGTLPNKLQENFEMEIGYLQFTTGLGTFRVGYQPIYQWGLDWMNAGSTGPRAGFATQLGPVTLGIHWDKVFEVDTSNVSVGGVARFYQTKTDADDDAYGITGIYKWQGGDAGLLFKYYQFDSKKPAEVGGYTQRFYLVSPYFRATFGPVYLEGEAQNFFGKARAFENPATPDIDWSTWAAYLMGRVNFGPAYVGGMFSYSSGDDFEDPTKVTTRSIGSCTSWNPTLIVANDDEASWHPSRVQWNEATKSNIIWYQIFGGYKATPKLDLFTSLSYMTVADKHYAKGKESASNVIGTEIDVKVTYKIFDQLTYMVGFGYLFAGDNWKDNPLAGMNPAPGTVGNDYIVLNKLELLF